MESNSNDKSMLKASAQTKLWIEWANPNRGHTNMTYYSYETPDTIQKKDIRYGIGRLLKLLFDPHVIGNYNVARVYHMETGKPIFEVRNNKVEILQKPLSKSTTEAIEANFRKFNYLHQQKINKTRKPD